MYHDSNCFQLHIRLRHVNKSFVWTDGTPGVFDQIVFGSVLIFGCTYQMHQVIISQRSQTAKEPAVERESPLIDILEPGGQDFRFWRQPANELIPIIYNMQSTLMFLAEYYARAGDRPASTLMTRWLAEAGGALPPPAAR